MSTQNRGATDDYSKEIRGSRALPLPARAAAGLALAGVVLAVVATFTKVIRIEVNTVETFSHQGWDRWGPALPLLAVFAVLMLAGAWRGARPAMAGVAGAGLAILAIVAAIDVPHVNDEGVWPSADVYEDAAARAGIGFYFESAAGVLLLMAGGLMLLLSPGRAPAREPSVRDRGPEPPPNVRPETEAPAAGDWFESQAQRLTQPRPEPRRRRFGRR